MTEGELALRGLDHAGFDIVDVTLVQLVREPALKVLGRGDEM